MHIVFAHEYIFLYLFIFLFIAFSLHAGYSVVDAQTSHSVMLSLSLTLSHPLSPSLFITFFFMAISHFIVQLTVTFTHTWSGVECVGVDNVASLPSRVPAKCVVCCLLVLRPSLYTTPPPALVSTIVQTPAGCVLRVVCFGFSIGRRANFVWCV